MWKFASYIKNHKIALLGVGKCLADRYENIDYWSLYIDTSGWMVRRMFKLYEHLPRSLQKMAKGEYWYGEWKAHIADYDVVIICSGIRGRDVIEYIQDRNPNARILVHLESPLDDNDRKHPRFYRGLKNLEFSTFDKNDSIRYGIPFVRLYYDPEYFGPLSMPFHEIMKTAQKNGIQQDVYYVGHVHHRLDRLLEIQDILETQGISHKFTLVKQRHHHYDRKYEPYLTDQEIPYAEVLQNVLQSRCILEVSQSYQRGMTYRAMEAAVFRKRLITSNPYAKDYEYYTSERVFILGVDPIEKLKEFVRRECPWGGDKADISVYTPEHWLDKLLFGGEMPEASTCL